MSEREKMRTSITIIGGGPGGYVAALKAGLMGAEVVLIEKEELGGTCLNWGCIPTKALVRSAEVYKNLRQAADYGFRVDNISIDIEKVYQRKDEIVKQLVKGIEFLLKKRRVNVIKGTGSIKEKNLVIVEKTDGSMIELETENIIIATGSKSVVLPIKGTDLEGVITSREALSLKEIPGSMVIIGGGIIGLEFAFIFSSFGVEVTVLEYFDRLLPGAVDIDVSRELTRAAKKEKIKVITSAEVTGIEAGENDCCVTYKKGDREDSVIGEKVLMAVGRKPRYDGLGLEKLGIELNEGERGIKVNEQMETNIPSIYAIGDVTNKVLLAHVASHQGIVAVKNILGQECKMDYNTVPAAIFTDPEVATVGQGEDQLKDQGIEYEKTKIPYGASGKALAAGDARGFIKILKDKETGKIIGGTIIGLHATDLIAELTLAVKNGLTAEELTETIHAHPTTAELIHEAVLKLEGGAIHTL